MHSEGAKSEGNDYASSSRYVVIFLSIHSHGDAVRDNSEKNELKLKIKMKDLYPGKLTSPYLRPSPRIIIQFILDRIMINISDVLNPSNPSLTWRLNR